MLTWKAFLATFRDLNLSFAFVLAYEILFFLSVTGFALIARHLLGNIGVAFAGVDVRYVTESTAAAVQSFFVQSISVFVGLMAAIFIAYVLFQGLAWFTVMHKKPTVKSIGKFYLANLGWCFGWGILMWFVIAGLRSGFAATAIIVLMCLSLHLTALMQHGFISGMGVRHAMGFAFSTGIGKIHTFIIPYVLAVLLFLIWSQVWRLIPLTQATGFAYVALVCLIFAPFLAWYKFYLHRLLTQAL